MLFFFKRKEFYIFIKVIFIGLLSIMTTSCASTNSKYVEQETYSYAHPDNWLNYLLEKYEEEKRLFYDADAVQPMLERLAAKHPEHKKILLANAIVAFERKEKNKAQQFLDQSLSLHSVNPQAAVLRSQIAIEDGNLNLAKRILNKQISLVPNKFELYETLASVHFLEKDYEKAMDSMKMAYELGAPKGRIKYHLGLIEEQKGRKQRAMGYYKQALISEPPFEQAKVRLDALEAEFKNTNWLKM